MRLEHYRSDIGGCGKMTWDAVELTQYAMRIRLRSEGGGIRRK